MALKDFEASLLAFIDTTVEVSGSGVFPEPASAQLLFSDSSRLRADSWRIILGGKAGVSSFVHNQKYGLPAPIDAILHLKQQLKGKRVTGARLDERNGDLLFRFEDDIELEVFNFTAYEVWEIQFPNGTGEYSNYARPYAKLDQTED